MSFAGPGAQSPQHQPPSPHGAPPYAQGGTPHYAPASPPPEKKQRFSGKTVLIAALALIALVVAIVVGVSVLSGDDGDTDAGPTPAADPASAAPEADNRSAEPEAPTEDADAGIGDAVNDGTFKFVVTGVETGVATVGGEFLHEDAQGQFVLVQVTVTNLGDEPYFLSGNHQILIDDAGQEYTANPTAGTYIEGNSGLFTELTPGSSVNTTIVYDIPADAAPASVELHESSFSTGVSIALTD